ncbi:MAG: HGxxPAAW family protein [Arachnia sp.]
MPSPRYYHHGRSPAAWFGFICAAIGAVVASVGAAVPNTTVLVIGSAVLAVACVGTLILKAIGYGQP